MNTHSERRPSPAAPRAPTPHCEPPLQESSHPQIGPSPIHFDLRAKAVHAATPNPMRTSAHWLCPCFPLCQDQPHNVWGPMCVLVTQSCPTLWDSVDWSLAGSSVHGISQAGILEQIATPFSRGSSQPTDQTPVSCPASRFFTIWATREAPIGPNAKLKWGPLMQGASVSVTIEH